jgi:hypothetical protein
MTRKRRRSEAGLTLMEVLIAVSLLSLLSLGIVIALRVGLSATAKANARLMDDRRIAGTQRILQDEIAGLIPVKALCTAGNPDPRAPGREMLFFQGQAESMRFVSMYSLQQAWRGLPQVLEFQVIPRDDGRGVRLVVNEHVYTGARGAGMFCIGPGVDPATHMVGPRFRAIEIGPISFVLADDLAFCRFAFLTPAQPPAVAATWQPVWTQPKWPFGVRVEMAPFADDAARLRPVTITQRIRVNRSPEIDYVDQYQ